MSATTGKYKNNQHCAKCKNTNKTVKQTKLIEFGSAKIVFEQVSIHSSKYTCWTI